MPRGFPLQDEGPGMKQMFHDLSVEQDEERSARRFLSRFVSRGWLHATREDAMEQAAVDRGLRHGWLRRELSEVHFTPKGRKALHG